MALKIITEGDRWNLNTLGQYEGNFAEGDRGELRLYLSVNVPDWSLTALQNSIQFAGVELWDNIKQDNRIVYIRFKKAIAPLMIMAIIIAAAIAIVILLLGWQLFKEVKELGPWGIPVSALIIGGFALGAYLLTRR